MESPLRGPGNGFIRLERGIWHKFKTNTVRIIIKLSTDDPLSYKIKFISEYSGKSGTAFNADKQYHPFNRILKKYDGFLEELSAKLKN